MKVNYSQGKVQLIVVYKMFLDGLLKGRVFCFSYVFVRGGLSAQAPAELGRRERTAQDRQRCFDPAVTTTKTEKRG